MHIFLALNFELFRHFTFFKQKSLLFSGLVELKVLVFNSKIKIDGVLKMTLKLLSKLSGTIFETPQKCLK